jgi:hypothetical protein
MILPRFTVRVLAVGLLLAAACGAEESGEEAGLPVRPDVTPDGGVTQDGGIDTPDAGRVDATGDALGAGAVAIDAIKNLAGTSACFKYSWKDRGQMPPGYIKGAALVFARAVCNQTRSDVLVVSKANTGDDAHDALSWYEPTFVALGMTNDVAGIATLRHTYTLLLGLGMRESSGEHCAGRDMSATNVSSDSAEAGAWQTSWDSRGASAELPTLFDKYKASSTGCLLDTFAEGVTCSAANWQNWGTGVDGLAFQKMEKECPTFAAEYAAVMIRVQGGSTGHYGPLRGKTAEVRPECDALFQQVQGVVEQNPSVCVGL